MSRVGKQVIPIPNGVEVKLDDRTVRVKGPKGELSYDLLDGIEIDIEGGECQVRQTSQDKNAGAFHGLSRARVNNLVVGVSDGFSKSLEIIGTGYRAAVSGSTVTLNLGFSHPIDYALPDGVSAKVEGNVLTVTGIDKEVIGQVAAEIRKFRPPEPYKGKGVRYVDEHVRRKAGKSAGA